MPNQNLSTCDIAVVGGGPAGLLCALLTAQAGAKTTLIMSPQARPMEGRTVALMQGSVTLLERVGVWEHLAGVAAPMRRMRLIDATEHVLQAPTAVFDSAEIGLPAFGYNIPNTELENALTSQLRQFRVLVRLSNVTNTALGESHVDIYGEGLHVRAKLAVAADGRRSLFREAAGISARRWSYPQSAVTAILDHEAPHHDTSSEFHTRTGPLTFVPLPGNSSSLVAVTSPDDTDFLMSLSEREFGFEIERRAQSLLGKFSAAGQRACWPLEGLMPDAFAKRRTVLVGEAAHVLPPIGAQGLNLGFRDALLLAELIGSALQKNGDPGSSSLLNAYHQGRQADIRLRSFAVDAFNRSLLAPFLPVHFARGFGLYLAQTIPPVRRAFMRMGLAANDGQVSRVS